MGDQSLDEFLGVKPVPWWRRYLKWLAIGLVVIGLILLLARCFGGSSEAKYATQPVRRDTLQVTVSATGRLAPTNQVQVGSELSGLVLKVLVDVNDRVRAGQAIALIDPSRFADTVRQSEAQLAANRAGLAQADATLAQDRAQLGRLEEVYRLSGGKVPSATELSAGRAEYGRAKAALAAAQANVVSAQAALSSNQTNLTKTVIRSPVNGVVLARQVEPGQTVAASFNTPTLFVIAQDLAEMKLPVAIDEADVGEVTTGQRASFTVDAFPGERFPATITRVELGSNQTVTSSSTTSAAASAAQVVSYIANLAVKNQSLRLRPGMTATAEIITTARSNVLLVPNAALRFTPATSGQAASGGGLAGALTPRRPRSSSDGQAQGAVKGRGASQTIYVLEGGQPKAVSIRTGVSDGTMTEVIGGTLQPGMLVITGQLASANG
ncbi:efflux RND transporter periplasmic adaptor subunit [Novosphingobium sp. KCTC 2891]|uniref:efflux RND transporter periplasmic adaptor subunit n=1 Tax=Novosphingobium sp. KCTC 2891 TaxID=2989730 RepID=UPI0022228E6C|nr:efflux RND transporter periplasmic adaptor subunit [Novosphingobium sp. KCTC 2891]MCW1381519.1 efflux RND transporter periplasmic adaptor subunit [Novosphingobium sp. KCTC 2891]